MFKVAVCVCVCVCVLCYVGAGSEGSTGGSVNLPPASTLTYDGSVVVGGYGCDACISVRFGLFQFLCTAPLRCRSLLGGMV